MTKNRPQAAAQASERPRPPALPAPKEHTGQADLDALLDLREHVAEAAGRLDGVQAAVQAINADAIGKQVAGVVSREAESLRAATREANEAATAAQEAAQAARKAPRWPWVLSAAVAVSVALVGAVGLGWMARDLDPFGSDLPTCAEPPQTTDSGLVVCVVKRP
jgi:cobalamin biosynthesis Mg chelatase CobN